MLQGQKTQFFTDVKIPIHAGMRMNAGKISDFKIRKVGYEVFRHYYDTSEKDCQVGSERVKRVING